MHPNTLTKHILTALVAGMVVGVSLHQLQPHFPEALSTLNQYTFDLIGQLFITALKMVVVPVVFVSLVCGVCQLKQPSMLVSVGAKTLGLYLLTTAIAITIGLTFATLTAPLLSHDLSLTTEITLQPAPPLKHVLINLLPSNPIQALATGNILQIIFFALFLGVALSLTRDTSQIVIDLFVSLQGVVMVMVKLILLVAPLGVFCLITRLFLEFGFDVLQQVAGYFVTVACALVFHVFVTNSLLLKVFAGLSPITFFRKMYSAMLFAFSTSSSNASIPIVLNTVEKKLGVKNTIASLIIPLGATINMDGTAIMQGVATVFIATAYHIDLTWSSYLIILMTATLASIGTAGVPSVGLIMLAMVLQQVGIPVEGIALIIGIDRILDMMRTAVNITGDSAVACIVAKSEQQLNLKRYAR